MRGAQGSRNQQLQRREKITTAAAAVTREKGKIKTTRTKTRRVVLTKVAAEVTRARRKLKQREQHRRK